MGSSSRKKSRHLEESSDNDSSSSEESSDYSRRSSKSRRRHRHRSDGSSRREKERREKEEKRRRRKERRERERKRRKLRRRDESESSSGDDSEPEERRVHPQVMVQELLKEFPNVGNDLKQLLQMIDNRQAVDIKGISERSLIKHLKKLFLSLSLKESGDNVFLLPSNVRPTLEVVGPLLNASTELKSEQLDCSAPLDDKNPAPDGEGRQEMDDNDNNVACPEDDAVGPRKRMIGPAMPSAELLAAAAKLTEAHTGLREAELDEDDEIFVGPPPPAMVAEAASANEAERFEEVTRIMGVEADLPYDILGVNQNRSAENIKKRYWKISLLVHPDKCSHPQAHQAFIKLNKAFKELQDPEKKKALDEKIKFKEEQEKFKVELRAMREAAQWRRSQGISMEGDDELLAEPEIDVKVPRQRDEWMTTLPPERKPGVTMHSTRTFSTSAKEGRGDTSAWTDTPSDRAQKAKMKCVQSLLTTDITLIFFLKSITVCLLLAQNTWQTHLVSNGSYLEAYNEATALASNEVKKSADADLVDKYNKEKRSKSLVQKHQEEKTASCLKKKSVQKAEKEEWVGQHPWKPWDREKDLVAGRKSINFDSENMSAGLSSRFSSGSFQRNFL